MKKIENECVCCAPELGCSGGSCRYRNVIRFYCDRCKEETTLYNYYGEELCQECLLKEFDIVDGSEWN